MINLINLQATLQDVDDNTEKQDSVLLKLEITPGEIFKISPCMLKKLCKELRDGVTLTECGNTEGVLPFGISRDAQIENESLSTRIVVPRAIQFCGSRSYASTDDFIRVFKMGIIRDFCIGIVDVVCQCNTCNEPLSSKKDEPCMHLLNQQDVNSEVGTFTIEGGSPLFISAESFRVTDEENIQLLLENWGLDMASLMEVKLNALSQSSNVNDEVPPEVINHNSNSGLAFTKSRSEVGRRSSNLRRTIPGSGNRWNKINK